MPFSPSPRKPLIRDRPQLDLMEASSSTSAKINKTLEGNLLVFAYQTLQNSIEISMLCILLHILCHLAFVRDRGAINLMLTWLQFIFLLQNFGLISKNFSSRGECHEATFGNSLITFPFAAMLQIFISALFKVTYMAYTEGHAVRGHSVVLLHRLLDVYFSLPQSLISLDQSLTNIY